MPTRHAFGGSAGGSSSHHADDDGAEPLPTDGSGSDDDASDTGGGPRKHWAPQHWRNEAKALAEEEERTRKRAAAARLRRLEEEKRQREALVKEEIEQREKTRDDVAAALKEAVKDFRTQRYQQAKEQRAAGRDVRGFALLDKPRTDWGEVEAPKGHTAGGARPHYNQSVDFRTATSLPPVPVNGIDYTRSTILELMRLVSRTYHDPAEQAAATRQIQALMQGSFNIDHRVDGYNMRTVMMEAAYHRNDAACVALLQRKANPNARAKFGRTALHIAAVNFASRITRALIDARADPNVTDRFKRTALDVVRAKFVPATNELLLAEKNKADAMLEAEMQRLMDEKSARERPSAEGLKASPELRNFLYNEPVSLPHLLAPLVDASYYDLKTIQLMEPEDLMRDVRGITRAEARSIYKHMPSSIRITAAAIVGAARKKQQESLT